MKKEDFTFCRNCYWCWPKPMSVNYISVTGFCQCWLGIIEGRYEMKERGCTRKEQKEKMEEKYPFSNFIYNNG